MYSRDYGGIQSDGVLHQAMEDYRDEIYGNPPAKKPLIDISFIKNLQTDDLLIIAIGLLLLLDSDMSSDMILLLVAAMLINI